jgi:hypothetical protein
MAQPLPPLNGGESRGDMRYQLEDGWKPLINGTSMEGWRATDGKSLEWLPVRGVR